MSVSSLGNYWEANIEFYTLLRLPVIGGITGFLYAPPSDYGKPRQSFQLLDAVLDFPSPLIVILRFDRISLALRYLMPWLSDRRWMESFRTRRKHRLLEVFTCRLKVVCRRAQLTVRIAAAIAILPAFLPRDLPHSTLKERLAC